MIAQVNVVPAPKVTVRLMKAGHKKKENIIELPLGNVLSVEQWDRKEGSIPVHFPGGKGCLLAKVNAL